MTFELAKDCVDVGLVARDHEAVMAFWRDEVGAVFEESLPTGSGNVQHRHDLRGSVLKINQGRTPPGGDAPRSAIRELLVASPEITEPRSLVDPDGNAVTLVPPGHLGVTRIGIVLGVRDAATYDRFYGEILGLECIEPGVHRCGTTMLRHAAVADGQVSDGPLSGAGYRYLTVQVHSCADEHGAILARGGVEAMPPRTMGDVATFSMVRDPDGIWVEISQRKNLVGRLD